MSESVDELRFGRGERNSNVRATMIVDYLNRDPVLRNLNGASASTNPVPGSDSADPIRSRPVEPEVVAEPESLNRDGLLSNSAENDQVMDSFFGAKSTIYNRSSCFK